MRSDAGYSADCILALARGEDTDKAWDGAVLVSHFLHLVTMYLE